MSGLREMSSRNKKAKLKSAKLEVIIITLLIIVFIITMLLGRHYNYVLVEEAPKPIEKAQVEDYQDYTIQVNESGE